MMTELSVRQNIHVKGSLVPQDLPSIHTAVGAPCFDCANCTKYNFYPWFTIMDLVLVSWICDQFTGKCGRDAMPLGVTFQSLYMHNNIGAKAATAQYVYTIVNYAANE